MKQKSIKKPQQHIVIEVFIITYIYELPCFLYLIPS
jgi:hypothetical protein